MSVGVPSSSSAAGRLAATGLALALVGQAGAEQPSEREVMFQRYIAFPSMLRGGVVEANWTSDGSSFWYAEESSGETRYYLVDPKADSPVSILATPPDSARRSQVESSVARPGEIESPDGGRFASVQDHNLWVRAGGESDGVQVTEDGEVDYEWVISRHSWVKGFWSGTGAQWSPDSRRLALKKVDGRTVEDLPFVRFLEDGAPLGWTRFARAGEPTFRTELWVLDLDSGERVQLETGSEPDQRLEILAWQGDEVLVVRLNRRHTRLDLLGVNATTGRSRVLFAEERPTYVVGAGHEFEEGLLTPLPDGDRFIWRSERDGWKHFYLYDFDGNLIRQLTHGEFPVLSVETLDGDWLYYTARSAERPYDRHLYRVRLEGGEGSRLTEATGSHVVEFSPSKEYFLDTHSDLDRPPAVDLRRADGSLVANLAQTSMEDLEGLPWIPPEEFVVKALDGETDLYGVLFRPWDFDPAARYPVVEYIYNGPQSSLRAFRSPFTAQRVLRALAQLGFIVFVADGPGSPERGRDFHEAAFGRYGRFEIPEHVGILRQLAASRPYMDLDRVGIVGHSHGGYLALRALLTEPDIYHVGWAMSPDVDFFHDAHFYFEPYLGFPRDNPQAYEEGSNLRLAANLRGKLMISVGTEDYGAYPGAMKMVGELIRLRKEHDLVLLPGAEHDSAGANATYELDAGVRFLVEHLKP